MIKKSITYTNFNEEEVTEDFFFHLSQAEIVELELSEQGGLSEALKEIIATEDGKLIIHHFKNIILNSYGQRSDDGRRFIKNTRIREEFESSEAYSVLFMELVTDAGNASEFVNGIVPKNLLDQAQKVVGADLAVVPTEPEVETVSPVDIEKMSSEELLAFRERLASGAAKIDTGSN